MSYLKRILPGVEVRAPTSADAIRHAVFGKADPQQIALFLRGRCLGLAHPYKNEIPTLVA
jgi:hypothetical protein